MVFDRDDARILTGGAGWPLVVARALGA